MCLLITEDRTSQAQKIGINGFVREGLCAGGLYEGSIRGVSVKEKVALSAGTYTRGALYAGGGGGRGL